MTIPISANNNVNVSFLDALFSATSAVCVTGLAVIDIGDSFNIFGRTVMALLIQVGGLGFASVGVGFFLLTRKKVSFKDRLLIKEALNLNSLKGIIKLVKSILIMTLCFEGIGTVLSFIVFSKDYPPLKALGISVFHAVSSFNNAGFDILGNFQNLIPYANNVLLNLTTCGLIIFGGLGFFVIKEIIQKRSFKKFSLHTKIVITMTIGLLSIGTILIKYTEDISWLGAFFFSTSARTAGFTTHAMGTFTNATLFVIIMLMFIGASPGSTGGGIKTTTTFTLFQSAYSIATNKHCSAFKRKIPNDVVMKAFVITLLAGVVVCVDTLLLSSIEPDYTFMQILFEVVSAFGTVGLSTGITPELSEASKIILILTMFIGRLGPLTIATIWSFKPMSSVSYSEETITIG
ncbi:TrkH family potassium uptake protein [Anaerocolumna cellulosilytica]|uniref:TrkH family potassium uptake protein n=1 Tax=Anaerocolumna cellulosilytica TaxID=433286 RepID=A0A6S6R277_9FIRM|nr:TrkH family potassium uptake protein [Anaerocolumna cellulosilytica]